MLKCRVCNKQFNDESSNYCDLCGGTLLLQEEESTRILENIKRLSEELKKEVEQLKGYTITSVHPTYGDDKLSIKASE